MFRRPIKPKKNATQNRLSRPLVDNEDDDEGKEEGGKGGIQNKMEREPKKRRTIVRNVRAAHLFGEQEEETLEPESSWIRKARPSEFVTASDEDEPHNHTSAASLYSKDAMAQLKAEQKMFISTTQKTDESKSPLVVSKTLPQQIGGGEEEEACMSLNGKKEEEDYYLTTGILTGEEALLFENDGGPDLDDDPVDMDGGDFNMDSEDVQDWENEVARRAGISMLPSLSPSNNNNNNISMQKLQDNIASAILQIRAQQEDVVRVRERREQQVHLLEEDLRRSRDELKHSGEAFEYFQKLRQKLALWIGAMRDLQTKVLPIQDALYQLEADVAALERWHDFEDDTVYYLKKQGRLIKVLGRQPTEAEELASLSHVDEFGRNVQSQQSLHREKRLKHLQAISEQRQLIPRGDESDALLSDNEQEEFRERHSALQEALSVALESLDEQFTKLQWLVDEFALWKKDYAAEYKQCYASLSLADLASVLVRAELCELNDPWNESEGYNEAKWTTVIRSAQSLGLLDDVAIERLMEKSVLPAIQSLLSKEGLNLCSTKEVKAMGAFLRHVEPFLPPKSAVGATLKGSFVNYIQLHLTRIAIPIPSFIAEEQHSPKSEVDLSAEHIALQYATIGQLHRIKKILTNVLIWWVPFLQVDHIFGEFILDFIGNKFLFLLSATRPFEQPRFSASQTDMFTEVWNAIQPTGWLNDPNLLVTSATVRAAAMAYGLS